jgi:transposase-like protein
MSLLGLTYLDFELTSVITCGSVSGIFTKSSSQLIKKLSPSKSDPLISQVTALLAFCENITQLRNRENGCSFFLVLKPIALKRSRISA